MKTKMKKIKKYIYIYIYIYFFSSGRRISFQEIRYVSQPLAC